MKHPILFCALFLIGCASPKIQTPVDIPTPVLIEPIKPEIKRPILKPKAKPQLINKVEPEVKTAPPEIQVIPDIENDKILKRQTLFVTVCESHPIVSAIAEKYDRTIKYFGDGKIESQNKINNGFSTIILRYHLKNSDTKALSEVICVFNEQTIENKINYKLVSLKINGFNIK